MAQGRLNKLVMMNEGSKVGKTIRQIALGIALTIASECATLGVSYSFDNITTPVPTGDQSARFSLDVTQDGSMVLFTIRNAGTSPASLNPSIITGITIQDEDNLLSSPIIINATGVSFVTGGGANLPSSLGIDEDFAFQRASAGGVNNGLNQGQSLGLKFTGDFAQVIADLTSGDIRVGLHAQNLSGTPTSQKAINRVPDASSTAMLMGLVLVAMAGVRRRFE